MTGPVDYMSRIHVAASALLVLMILVLLFASTASAEFSPADLLSGTQRLPFDDASNPAFAQEGNYVVFQGSLAGMPGIYRRNLKTDEVSMVAGEVSLDASAAESLLSAPDASAPSISAEGRYVAFTSTAVLDRRDEGPDAEDGGGCPQVYVRDMDLTLADPEPYVLASAVNKSNEGLSYEKPCPAGGGAAAAGGVALSADGRKVAFTVLSRSDLTNGEREHLTTEGSQVAVRDLSADTTTLVSVTPEGQATPGGGAYPSTQSEPKVRISGSSAAISGDGSTVAWEGTNVPAQVTSATDVEAGMARFGGAGFEVEPLWRRIADGSTATTRRLLANAGLHFYSFGITHLGEGEQPVRGGALALEPQLEDEFIPPALSWDGSTVATIANAFTSLNEDSYGFVGGEEAPPAEAYAIHVENDLTSPPQVTPLTATPDYAALNAIHGAVDDVAISPDGSLVAFNTRRVNFAQEPPVLISPPVLEGADAYTYVTNLDLGTLERVTSTYDGASPNGEPGQLSFADDDVSLAFASSASNLFYGDATPGASQVYLSQEAPPADQLASQSESPPPLEPFPTPMWVLSAVAAPQADGSVLVDAYVPSAGKLTVRAGAQLPVKVASKNAPAKDRRVKARRSRVAKSVQVPSHTVAQATAVATADGELRLRLHVSAAYRKLVAGKDGLYCVLTLSFTAPGHAMLSQEIPVTLRQIQRKQDARTTRTKKPRSKKVVGDEHRSHGKSGVRR